jgi:hypothetical protein
VVVYGERGRVLGRFCPGRNSSVASAGCVGRLLAVRPLICAGCDEVIHVSLYQNANGDAAKRLRSLCDECQRLLRDAKKEPRSWYAIGVYDLLGRPLPLNCHADYRSVASALGDILERTDECFISEAEPLIGTGNFNTEDIWARLTKRQADGVRAFAAAYGELVAQVAASSKKEGGALLVRLARGEVSIDEFNDGRKPRR